MTAEATLIARERILETRKSSDVPFTICRRVKFVTADKVAPWDRVDQCAECGDPVLYDSRDSMGKPHICMVCAYLYRQSFLRPDTPLDDLLPDMDSLTDEDIVKRMDQTRQQNLAGENVGAAPSLKPTHKYASTAGLKRSYRV